MNYSDFIKSTKNDILPNIDSQLLISMWYAIKGKWHKAHEIVQEIESKDAAWIHAYLHRVEGDLSNAKYWYVKADRDTSDQSLDLESKEIVKHLIR